MRLREATPADGPAIRAIVAETLAEFGFALESNGTDSDLDDIGASYQDRGGVFRVLIGDDDRTIVGCGGLYPLSADTVELRKMYFRPDARGRGLGREMLTDLIDQARRRGFDNIVLETASNLSSAIRLYEKAGFVETQDPKHASRCDRTFALRLHESTPEARVPARSPRRAHPALLVLLAVATLYGSVAFWRRQTRPPGRWVGYTECAWIGQPRVVVREGMRPMDSLAVVAHESVHAAQCVRLGPIQYRWRTLFPKSNLELETPAYCAGASVRSRISGDTAFVRATIPIDMIAAMGDVVDSLAIVHALESTCPQFAPKRQF